MNDTEGRHFRLVCVAALAAVLVFGLAPLHAQTSSSTGMSGGHAAAGKAGTPAPATGDQLEFEQFMQFVSDLLDEYPMPIMSLQEFKQFLAFAFLMYLMEQMDQQGPTGDNLFGGVGKSITQTNSGGRK
jgi:hypothetical protein